MDRRTLLAGMAGGVAAATQGRTAVLPSSRLVRGSGKPGTAYTSALDAVADYAAQELAFWGLPGMTITLVDADGFTAVISSGYADAERGVAVAPDQLFQIGSISKSFAAATLLTFVDEGRLDLDAPLARYLPDLPLPAEPITVAQVLCHSAGLPEGAPVFPRVPDGRLWCGYRPGTRFSYSNAGYALLGLLIGRLGGMPHPDVLRHRLLEPLGMHAARPVIVDRDRPRYAVGYAPVSVARPFLPGQALTPGLWANMDEASGSIAATADDMARYLEFLIRAARGDASPLLSPAAARRLVTPTIDADIFGPGARYGPGLATVQLGGQPCLHHTGGMLTFSSSMHVDGKAGVACFASVNAGLGNGYRPRLVTAYAVELMRAARGGKQVAPPDVAAATRIVHPGRIAGRYAAADGNTVEIIIRGREVVLNAAGRNARLILLGDLLATDHPDFADAAFHVEQDVDRISGLWWKEILFRRGRGAAQPFSSTNIRNLAGWYESTDPWVGGVILRAQGDSLVVDSANTLVVDSGSTLVERNGYWSLSKDDTVERWRFDAPVDGRPSRLSCSGWDMIRREFDAPSTHAV